MTCPRVCQIQDLCRKKYKEGIFSDVQWWKKNSTHFSDSTHQECMIFARIGHGSCYSHWNEIFAGVYTLYNLGYTNRFLQLLTWTLACGKVASSRLSWLVVHLKIFRLAKRVQNWIVYCSSACDFTIKIFEADCYIYFWLQGYASLWVMVVIVFVSNFLITYAFY